GRNVGGDDRDAVGGGAAVVADHTERELERAAVAQLEVEAGQAGRRAGRRREGLAVERDAPGIGEVHARGGWNVRRQVQQHALGRGRQRAARWDGRDAGEVDDPRDRRGVDGERAGHGRAVVLVGGGQGHVVEAAGGRLEIEGRGGGHGP